MTTGKRPHVWSSGPWKLLPTTTRFVQNAGRFCVYNSVRYISSQFASVFESTRLFDSDAFFVNAWYTWVMSNRRRECFSEGRCYLLRLWSVGNRLCVGTERWRNETADPQPSYCIMSLKRCVHYWDPN